MPRPIPEYLIRYLWKDHAHFLLPEPRLTDGSLLTILDAGVDNEHRGGPDFLNARVAIDDVALAGDVELHLQPHHWDEHDHGADSRYSQVILHVVLEDESDETHRHGPQMPTLVLRDNLAFERRDLWDELFRRIYDRSPELACFPHNLSVPIRFKRKVLDQFGEARLEELIDRLMIHEGVPTEDALLERVYQLTLDALGYSQNRTPFRELSSLLPRERLRFVRTAFGAESALYLEALYLGTAGLLPMPSEEYDAEANEYLVDMQARWANLQLALRLPEVLAESDWAFFRIRPLNSPYRRVALAAALAEKYFSREDFKLTSEFFASGPEAGLGASSFWESRTSYSARLALPQALLGEERRSAIHLNIILPSRIARTRLSFSASRTNEKEIRKEWGTTRTHASAKYLRVISQELLEGESVNSVRSEQGALTLLRNFCERSRCFECPIGSRMKDTGWTGPPS